MLDNIAVRGEALFTLIGRIFIGALFVPAGFRHITGLEGFAQYLAKGVPGPAIAWAVVAAAIEFFGSIALIIGFQTRVAAILLALFTLGAALVGHPFWAADEASRQMQYINFWKNIAIVGGLLFVFVRGAGPLSVDRR
jgi:putative oxidoreductase